MFHEDSQRGMHSSVNRKPKYNDKSHTYNSSLGYGYGNNSNSNYNGQQRRRPERHKHSGSSDKLIKQNDIIIKLLKEIRDRLPPSQRQAESEPEQDWGANNESESDNQEKLDSGTEPANCADNVLEEEEENFNS